MPDKRRVEFDAREKGRAPKGKRARKVPFSQRYRRELAPLYVAGALLFTGWVLGDVDGAVSWLVGGTVVLVLAAVLLTRSWVDRDVERLVVVLGVLYVGGWLLMASWQGITQPILIAWAALSLIGSVLWWIDWFQTGKARTPREKAAKAPKAPGHVGPWHSDSGLAAAFEEAGLLRPAKDGEETPKPRAVGRPDRDDYGTTVRVRLPRGVSYSKVAAARESLAAALDQPVHLVTISQLRTDPAGVARIRVSEPYERTIRTHDMPTGGTWRDPVVIGRDRRGRDVTFPTYDVGQVLVGGRTGSGKTHFLRLLAAHYAADPDASLYVVDGKGSTDDWGPLRPRCERLLFIHDDEPAQKFANLIEHVQALVTNRNRQGGRDWPGALVVLEEFSSLLAALDAVEKKEMEKAVTRLVQTCRSANVMVVIAAQRPSASTMDTNTRAQAAVSVALAMKSPTDITMVLGHTPTLELPNEPGEAIVVVPGREDVFVDLDTLPDGDWDDLCAEWAPSLPAPALSGVPAATQPSLLDEPEPIDHAQPIVITTLDDDEDEPLEHLTNDAELYDEAVALVTATQYASRQMLGRKLRIGWAVAGRLMDELEARHVVGPEGEDGRRAVLAPQEPLSEPETPADDAECPEPENGAEEPVAEPERPAPANATEAVWHFAVDKGGEFSSASVQLALDHYSRSSVKQALKTLVDDGRLTKPRHGFYAAKEQTS